MKNITIALTAALTLLATPVSSEERYLCETVTSGGVRYDTTSKEWVGTRFKTTKSLIISKPTDGGPYEGRAFVVTKLGTSYASGSCAKPFDSEGNLKCGMLFGELLFNKNTMRFLSTYMFGYLDGIDNNDNTPAISIGVCSPF
jgi:hypothetical protein